MITSVWSRPGVASGRLALASLAGCLLWPAAQPAPLRLPAPAVQLQGHYPGQLPVRFRDIGARSAFATGSSSEADRDIAEARKAIEVGNAAWGRARVAIDRDTFERMLAGDFYVVLPDRRLTRAAFIERITHFPYGRVTRFDPTVLTVERRGEAWEAIIMEKLEYDQAGAEGRTIKGYTLAVTRDGWKHTAEGWKVLFSELLGAQMWRDGSPPPMAFW